MAAVEAIRILGIDPGTRHTGYGLVEKRGRQLICVEAGAISPAAALPLARRLAFIHHELAGRLQALEPDQVAVEDIFHAVNVRAALQLAHVRGVILQITASAGLPVSAYAPAVVKKAVTGSGVAGKQQVAWMIERLLVRAPRKVRSDATDALAVAVCHATHLGVPQAVVGQV